MKAVFLLDDAEYYVDNAQHFCDSIQVLGMEPCIITLVPGRKSRIKGYPILSVSEVVEQVEKVMGPISLHPKFNYVLLKLFLPLVFSEPFWGLDTDLYLMKGTPDNFFQADPQTKLAAVWDDAWIFSTIPQLRPRRGVNTGVMYWNYSNWSQEEKEQYVNFLSRILIPEIYDKLVTYTSFGDQGVFNWYLYRYKYLHGKELVTILPEEYNSSRSGSPLYLDPNVPPLPTGIFHFKGVPKVTWREFEHAHKLNESSILNR